LRPDTSKQVGTAKQFRLNPAPCVMGGGDMEECSHVFLDEQQQATLSSVGEPVHYLPSFVTECCATEGDAQYELLLRKLATEPLPPSASQLSSALICLGRYDDLQYPMCVSRRVALAIALWKLFVISVHQPALYNYSINSAIADNLRKKLACIVETDRIKFWLDPSKVKDHAEKVQQIANLTSELDIQVPLRKVVDEINRSFRTDPGVDSSRRQNYVTSLMDLMFAMRRFVKPSKGLELVDMFSTRLDGRYCHVVFFARLLLMILPMQFVPTVLLDGRLWTWWCTLPEGVLQEFDLMWFKALARYAKLHWAREVSGTGVSAELCDDELRSQLPWLFNKLCRTLSLPFTSPATSVMDGGKSAPDLPSSDRYAIPYDLQPLVVGRQSAWSKVAAFIIYMLESEPGGDEIGKDAALADPASMWSMLFLLLRRLRPFLKPANATGEWVFHCLALLRYLTRSYFTRVCRERLLPCKVPKEAQLTAAADNAFIATMVPITNDILQSMWDQVTCLGILERLARIAAMHPSAHQMKIVKSVPSPFSIDIQKVILRAIDVLNDPNQADQHVSLLQVCCSTIPALLLRWPSAIGGILPVVLWGIDPADSAKTLASLNLLLALSIRTPYLDVNDWPERTGSTLSSVNPSAKLRWPLPGTVNYQLDDSEDSGVRLMTSLLPSFASDYFDRALEYVAQMPKPSTECSAEIGESQFESAATHIMHAVACIMASQCEDACFNRIVDTMNGFIATKLLPDQAKPMKLLLSAVVRSRPDVAVPAVLPPIFKRLIPARLATSGGLPKPLHDTDLSESESLAAACTNSCSAQCRSQHYRFPGGIGDCDSSSSHG